jgi:hypothetical protein
MIDWSPKYISHKQHEGMYCIKFELENFESRRTSTGFTKTIESRFGTVGALPSHGNVASDHEAGSAIKDLNFDANKVENSVFIC